MFFFFRKTQLKVWVAVYPLCDMPPTRKVWKGAWRMPCDNHGLGSSLFARHYWGNHCYFLFLEVLRCFSSLGSPHRITVITASSRWVVPFGNPRVKGYLLLTVAYRSLSRPSSPPWAKASTMRPWLLSFAFATIQSTANKISRNSTG